MAWSSRLGASWGVILSAATISLDSAAAIR
jgi:hypothetical protein